MRSSEDRKNVLRMIVGSILAESRECAWCHVPYRDADDFFARRPWVGYKGKTLVDDACWEAYKEHVGLMHTEKFMEVRALVEANP